MTHARCHACSLRRDGGYRDRHRRLGQHQTEPVQDGVGLREDGRQLAGGGRGPSPSRRDRVQRPRHRQVPHEHVQVEAGRHAGDRDDRVHTRPHEHRRHPQDHAHADVHGVFVLRLFWLLR